MKVLTLLGTRPELIKLSEIMKKLDKHTDHVFVHTGQNFDRQLNDVFYGEMGIRKPDHYLGVSGKSLADTIGNILRGTERVLDIEEPDAVVILGDTNSALGGIIAKRKKIPLFHLEAGNRCFDPNVPEEINRTIMDHIGDVNMVYSENARRNLLDEGVAKDRIFTMGSPMREVLDVHMSAIHNNDILDRLKLEAGKYFVVSIHRDENVEIPENFTRVVTILNTMADKYKVPIIVTTHPRLRKKIDSEGLRFHSLVLLHEPFGFFDYVKLQEASRCVVSDSGTIAEESAMLHFPAVTIRNAMERPEAVDVGSITMSGLDVQSVIECISVAEDVFFDTPDGYDVYDCSGRVLRAILSYTPYINKYVWRK